MMSSFCISESLYSYKEVLTIQYNNSVKEGFPYFCACRTIFDFESSDKGKKGKSGNGELNKEFCNITKIN
jgi:hypothetical protein